MSHILIHAYSNSHTVFEMSPFQKEGRQHTFLHVGWYLVVLQIL